MGKKKEQQQIERPTRSRSCPRRQRQGPFLAPSDAAQISSSDSPPFSPTSTEPLPPGNNNTSLLDANGVAPPSQVRKSVSPPLIDNCNAQFTGFASNNQNQGSASEVPPQAGAETAKSLGDNMESVTGKDPPKEDSSEKTLKLVLAELQDIKSQMVKLNKMETTTATLANDLQGVCGRIAELETSATSNSARLREVDDELSTISSTISKQERSLSKVETWKEEVIQSNSTTVSKMKGLIQKQQNQVDSFHSNVDNIKQDLMSELDKRIDQKVEERVKERTDKLKQDIQSQKLKDQAFNNRCNIVVVGLQEDNQKDTRALVDDFITKTLGVKNIDIKLAYRLGSKTAANPTYIRPILVKFANPYQRNRVWRNRLEITSEDGSSKIRIQADLPKVLREGMQVMYRVLKAALKIKKYESATITNYQLELDGKTYQVSDLEKLPVQHRPSTLASPRSDSAMVFFTRHSFLSNHHPSQFKIGDDTFHSMEHYLAVKKASLTGNEAMINRAYKVSDPVQAKHVLNDLKGNQEIAKEWDNMVETVALEGLRAKFSQNKTLQDKLRKTKSLLLGEASTNLRWGIGMDLNNPDVLSEEKWSSTGNLLGRTLMQVRQELFDQQV